MVLSSAPAHVSSTSSSSSFSRPPTTAAALIYEWGQSPRYTLLRSAEPESKTTPPSSASRSQALEPLLQPLSVLATTTSSNTATSNLTSISAPSPPELASAPGLGLNTITTTTTTTTPSKDLITVRLLATGLHRLVRSRASGTHYSSRTLPLPHCPGTDGIGRTADGRVVYFQPPAAQGSFRTHVTLDAGSVVELPLLLGEHEGGGSREEAAAEAGEAEGHEEADVVGASSGSINAVQAAALLNPALAGWMALTRRCQGIDVVTSSQDRNRSTTNITATNLATTAPLLKDWTLLVLGATSTSGKLAAALARDLGAARVIGAARNRATLAEMLTHGVLDSYVLVDAEQPGRTDFSTVLRDERQDGSHGQHVDDAAGDTDVDVVLDFLYGPVAEALFAQLKPAPGHGVQYVHVGSLAGLEVRLPGAVLRRGDVTIRGSGLGSWGWEDVRAEVPRVAEALGRVNLGEDMVFRVIKLQDIEAAWGVEEAKGERVVIVP